MIIHRAIGALPDGRIATAEDWPTSELAIQALTIVQAWGVSVPSHPDTLDILADGLAIRLGVDLNRPYGCSIIVEE